MGKEQKIAQIDRGVLKRVLKVRDLFAIGYGDLGSSIYYALGVTALYALGATPIALALAGVVFACTALTYAEMSSLYNESGGSASFARHAFNDLISFIAGWGLLLDYIVTISISAFAVGPYLSLFFPSLKDPWWMVLFGVLIIGILFVINARGIKQSTRMSFILASFTLLTQFLIIILGLVLLLDLPTLIEHLKINAADPRWSPTWGGFLKGTAMAMVAYTGIESIAQLGGETQNPKRKLPRAILAVMGVLIPLYLGIAVVALSALTPQVLSTTYLEDPIEGIVAAFPIFGTILKPWVGILAAILLFVAANAGLIGASRLSFNMGQYHQLPRFFRKLHGRLRTPVVSLATFAVLGSLIVILSRGKMEFLADLYNFGAMLAFFFAHLSLIVMRIKKPEEKRPFTAPLNIPFGRYRVPISAIIGCIATLGVWLLVVFTKPDGRNLGFIWLIVGVVTFVIYRKKQKLPTTGHLAIEKIKIPAYKPLTIQKILIPTKGGAHSDVIQAACELAKIHNAKIIALHVVEMPASIPLDFPLPQSFRYGEELLKRVEAVGREFNITIELKIIGARSTTKAIIETIQEEHCDLLILGGAKDNNTFSHKRVGSLTDELIKISPCRVWVLCTK